MNLHLLHRAPRNPNTRGDDRLPTREELNRLYSSALGDLQTLELLHAAEVAAYDRARAGVINRMGDLIAACEAYYGTDLRKVDAT